MEVSWSGEAKYRTLLAVAQATNAQRDLSRVLDAVAGALERIVPIDLVGVVTHEGEGVRLRAVSARDHPRPRWGCCGRSCRKVGKNGISPVS